MVRIAFLTSADLSGTTGDSVATREVVAALAALPDVQLALLSATPPDELPADVATDVDRSVSLPTKPAEEQTWKTVLWHGRLQLAMARSLAPLLLRRSPDLVVARVNPSMVVPPVLASLARTPYRILVRGVVPRNLSIEFVAGLAVCLNSRLADEAYVAFSEVKEMVDRCRPASKPGARILPNAVNPDQFHPRDLEDGKASLEFDPDEFVVGFVGTLRERHRTEELLRGAARSDCDVSLLVVGDGPERERLESLSQRLDVGGSVRFVGRVDHAEVDRYVAACDACYGVVDPERPSNPIKVYEYLACERPVITSWSEELSFVDSEGLGEIVDAVTPEDVGRAIDRLAARSPNERVEMGRRGRRYVEEHCTWTAFAYTIVRDDG